MDHGKGILSQRVSLIGDVISNRVGNDKTKLVSHSDWEHFTIHLERTYYLMIRPGSEGYNL